MAAKAIREATGKDLINRKLLAGTKAAKCRFVSITDSTDWINIVNEHPWLKTEKLVVKPDQLIKRRGKLGLIKVNADLVTVQKWIEQYMNKEQRIEKAIGKLKTFIIEPFIPHKSEEEVYVCIYSHRKADTILFHHQGGIDIGDVDAKALKLDIPVGGEIPDRSTLINKLLTNVLDDKKVVIAEFIESLYKLYVNLYFTYLEINPLVVTDTAIYVLDLAAKLDTTADFICKPDWGEIDYPPPFGRDAYPEEAYIADLDAKSGASLKLTILNPNGRIWTMVAGGGASVIYSDTICDLGAADELANYGEYSGAPSEQQTYEYAKTILSLMTKAKRSDGKVLIIGGGIANFTNVAATFKGIVKALQEYQPRLVEHDIRIFVRRAGPNYQEGLRIIREVGRRLGIPVHVFGPETHMTAICAMALGKKPIPDPEAQEFSTANFLLPSGQDIGPPCVPSKNNIQSSSEQSKLKTADAVDLSNDDRQLFTNKTKSIIWGMQTRAVQSMLDFDFVCRRSEPSVAAIVYPFTGDHKQKFYWGHKEVLIPVYKQMKDAMAKHTDADVMVTFASLRSAYESTMETLQFPQIRTIAIIAEGIPENMTRKLILAAQRKNVTIIGPATVGGVKPGCFKIGNTGGMMDNILHSKLYRPGSVAYVSRSGGMSNELNNIISKASNGVLEGVAIGGDRYPGTTFMNHIIRYQNNPDAKVIVLLGEVGGVEEYEVCQALKTGRITKPLIAWCIGTCASMFNSEVQFGHAGSIANSNLETAYEKNAALKAAGAYVPNSFDNLGDLIQTVYEQLVKDGTIVPEPEVPVPTVPMDYGWARGDRFGGALDGAARMFSEAYDTGLHPQEFVNNTRKKGELIMGIGHRVKSINNPDMRVKLIKEFVLENFPAKPLVEYALEVEKITTSKKPNLILNVDGIIACSFVDMLRNSGSFTREEAQEYIEIGAINSLFVLGRSIGFIGHYMDQKRLKQGLYRHPWDDISYVLPEQYN
ncbi:ATP-citrate synthase isoform X2 [Solenopsis invicta]|uniref:ATP-citrate synthase isoform X2 n=1 Tax=Solenopsis invicta TaxID=13686 RepID=UPI0005962E9F|nr:ATP-citrate synthase isoform X2 [Solenopsis invicta]